MPGVLGGLLALRHHWGADLRSTLAYSYVQVERDGREPNSALRALHYAAVNLFWSPLTRLNFGLEQLYGIRQNAGRGHNDATQTQLSMMFPLLGPSPSGHRRQPSGHRRHWTGYFGFPRVTMKRVAARR